MGKAGDRPAAGQAQPGEGTKMGLTSDTGAAGPRPLHEVATDTRRSRSSTEFGATIEAEGSRGGKTAGEASSLRHRCAMAVAAAGATIAIAAGLILAPGLQNGGSATAPDAGSSLRSTAETRDRTDEPTESAGGARPTSGEPSGSDSGSRGPEGRADGGSSREGAASNGTQRREDHERPASEGGHRRAVYRDEPIYENRTRTVIDREAWTGRERTGYEIVCSDGFVTTSEAELDRHLKEAAGRHESVSYSVRDTYSEVVHPAVTHTETYRVQIGTKRVFDHYE